uniref:Uncharacterized protein n=1 Tax=Anopheles stephensi TaxID=30069 RepID=A0A182YHF5_ANOST
MKIAVIVAACLVASVACAPTQIALTDDFDDFRVDEYQFEDVKELVPELEPRSEVEEKLVSEVKEYTVVSVSEKVVRAVSFKTSSICFLWT